MYLFYTPNITNEKEYTLDEAESKHAIRVLRLQENDIITLIDGKGNYYTTTIIDAHPKKCTAKITGKRIEENKLPKIHIAIAPTKNNERLEWFTEKSTEIGISEITPIICNHSERKKIKEGRLIKTAVSAMKQALKATLPTINDSTSFNKLIIQSYQGKKYIAHCYKEEKMLLKNCYTPGENVLILIGPEGDFSKEEVDLAIKNGFEPVSLGTSRLRTETAGIIACHTINLMNE